jgi:hypothetical protein
MDSPTSNYRVDRVSGPKFAQNGNDALKSKAPKVVRISPDERPGTLKAIGGSASDHFNNILVDQAVSSLWRAHSDSGSATE